jgi:iron(III) transport system ATP-binding protein
VSPAGPTAAAGPGRVDPGSPADPERRVGLQLQGVRQRYAHQPVLDGVDLTVPAGAFTAVLGESGSGKTTLLRVIAGFERIESGLVVLGGTVVDDGRRAVAPERRKVGYVPQEGALFPHLRVAGNVAFGLRRRNTSRRVAELLDLVGLAGLERRYPHELSGGQQQRVALARALAVEPDVVLLDEPFSSLDASLRIAIRRDVAQILRDRGTTTVLVTHDQDEALSMADRVAVLRAGRMVADARPADLYQHPDDAELASFVGEANLLPGQVEGRVAATVLGRLDLHPAVSAGWGKGGGPATVLVRPEQLEVGPAGGPAGIAARVVDRAYFGHDAMLHVTPIAGATRPPAGEVLLARVIGPDAPEPGCEVTIVVRSPVMAWPAPPPTAG